MGFSPCWNVHHSDHRSIYVGYATINPELGEGLPRSKGQLIGRFVSQNKGQSLLELSEAMVTVVPVGRCTCSERETTTSSSLPIKETLTS